MVKIIGGLVAFPVQLIMRHFSVEGDKCAYIGDKIEKDFIAPNELGWLTVQIRRKEGQYVNGISSDDSRARVRIHTLEDVERILEGE